MRFVNIYYGNWDAHYNLVRNHTQLCETVDQPIGALIKDLKQRGLLDTTLVVWAGEFGRTPIGENSAVDGKVTGRDHHPDAFSIWLAGGGVPGGSVIGATDELGWNAVEDRMDINDLHATMLQPVRAGPQAADLPLRRARFPADRCCRQCGAEAD